MLLAPLRIMQMWAGHRSGAPAARMHRELVAALVHAQLRSTELRLRRGNAGLLLLRATQALRSRLRRFFRRCSARVGLLLAGPQWVGQPANDPVKHFASQHTLPSQARGAAKAGPKNHSHCDVSAILARPPAWQGRVLQPHPALDGGS